VRRLLLVVVALIVYGSLYPWHFDFSPRVNPLDFLLNSWGFQWDRYLLRDVAVNVALYVPLGAAAALALARKHGRGASAGLAIVLGMTLSASVEMLQIYVPGRQCSLLDVTTNTIGTAAGAWLALIAWPSCVWEPLTHRRERHAGAAAFLLACWASFQLYPFFPILSRTRLWNGLALLLHASTVSPVEIWACAAEWVAAAVAMKALLGRMRLPWLVLAMACLPLRILIAERALGLDEVLGAALALLLWPAIDRASGRGGRPVLAAAAIGSAIVLRELEPFHFGARPAAFSWVPFAATLGSPWQSGAVIVLRKVFDYGAAVWLLRQVSGTYAYAGAIMTAALAALEAAQRYLPGRTPEATDAVIALLASFVLWRLDSTGLAPAR
jgi:VanZ family protein